MRPLAVETLRRLAFEVRESVFPAGTEVVREGDEDGVGFFIVVTGEGAVYVGERQAATVQPGDRFVALATSCQERVPGGTATW